MEKLAETTVVIHDMFARRWSPRAFADRPVEREKILALLEAARWSPSSRNEQPWAFFVATKEQPAAYQRLFDCLVDSNARWVKNAPLLILTVAKLKLDYKDRPNNYALHDVGLATMALLVQATALGLHAHPMAGFRKGQAQETLGIPETHQPLVMVAVGYYGDPGQLPDDLRERELAPRQRKPLTDFVFAGEWNQLSPLLTEEGT